MRVPPSAEQTHHWPGTFDATSYLQSCLESARIQPIPVDSLHEYMTMYNKGKLHGFIIARPILQDISSVSQSARLRASAESRHLIKFPWLARLFRMILRPNPILIDSMSTHYGILVHLRPTNTETDYLGVIDVNRVGPNAQVQFTSLTNFVHNNGQSDLRIVQCICLVDPNACPFRDYRRGIFREYHQPIVAGDDVVNRAIQSIGVHLPYTLRMHNCQHFALRMISNAAQTDPEMSFSPEIVLIGHYIESFLHICFSLACVASINRIWLDCECFYSTILPCVLVVISLAVGYTDNPDMRCAAPYFLVAITVMLSPVARLVCSASVDAHIAPASFLYEFILALYVSIHVRAITLRIFTWLLHSTRLQRDQVEFMRQTQVSIIYENNISLFGRVIIVMLILNYSSSIIQPICMFALLWHPLLRAMFGGMF